MSDAPKGADDRVHPFSKRVAFIDSPGFGRLLMLVLLIAFVALGLFDLVHHRHSLFPWEGFPGFHAWFGFLAFSFVVIMGWPLRALLSRPENYYGEGDDDA